MCQVYQIIADNENTPEIISVQHLPTGDHFSVSPRYGGAIVGYQAGGESILMEAGTSGDLEKRIRYDFAGCQMFPFPNRTRMGQYSYDKKTYALPVNDENFHHSLHGLIYDQPFEISAINEKEGKIALKYHFKKNERAYPFELQLCCEYTLGDCFLSVRTTITNSGEHAAPLGYGWHPYFSADKTVDDYSLQFQSSKYFICDQQLIPTGETGELNTFSTLTRIGNRQLNHCFELSGQEQTAHAITLSKEKRCEIKLTLEGFSYLQVYIPPDRKHIAIEPQTCIPDAFNNGIGLTYLSPGATKQYAFKIEVSNP